MQIDRTLRARGRLALREAVQNHLFDPNVNLIDFGYPWHGGRLAENELAIRIHVKRKLVGAQLEAAVQARQTRAIPASIGGFQTDVPEGSYHLHQWPGWATTMADPRAERVDPLRGGISISDEYHYAYGTLGGKVIDRATGDEMILSNWHVLVSEWWARPGQRIFQPGRLDGGTGQDTIATLTRDAMSVNLDAAVATLTSGQAIVNDQLDLGSVTGVGSPELGMQLVKSGRRTGITYGRVTAIEGVARLPYGSLQRVIRSVITIDPRSSFEPVSGPGDSGAWWLDADTLQVVGLHFAGSEMPERGLALEMQTVLDALSVDVATERARAGTAVLAGRIFTAPLAQAENPAELIPA